MTRFFRKIQDWFLSLFGKKIKEITQSRAELLQVFDGLSDPVIVIDREYVIQRVNDATLTTLGRKSYQQFIGKPCYVMLHGLKERCPSCTAPITFSAGEKTVRTGLMEAKKNPLATTYNITCYPLTSERGEVTAIAEYYRDSSEIVRLSRELYESERARVMEPLSAGLAHQIRQPLTIIRAATQYALETFQKDLESEDFKETMESIVQNVDGVNEVLVDLLSFSRPSQYQMKKGSLLKLLERGLRLVRQQIKEKKVLVMKEWPGDLPDFLMDEKLFLQAYLNLLINALEAMPKGGRLKVKAFQEDNKKPSQIHIVIEDTGKGIPKELVPKLFHPFFSTKEGGVGLGLSVAEGIIRSHGGQIRFESFENSGTKVVIELPLSGR